MRVLSVVHERDAGAGVFAQPLSEAGHEQVEWMPPHEPPPALDGFGAAMVFGGSMNVDQEAELPWLAPEKALMRELLARDVPTLGVCLGSQLLAEVTGAQPRRLAVPEIGWIELELTPAARDDPLLGPLPPRFDALAWHGYEAPLPPGATALASSAACLHAYRLPDSRSWGVQFHPEVTTADWDSWLAGFRPHPDAPGVDPGAIRRETARRMPAWNELGRGIARRFLDAAV